jgi:hypothetical protein
LAKVLEHEIVNQVEYEESFMNRLHLIRKNSKTVMKTTEVVSQGTISEIVLEE